MQKLTLANLPVDGKKVLMRVDFNVPIDAFGAITDDSRIVAALPSIRYVLENGGALILMSHLGRPKDAKDTKFSLEPVGKRLEQLLERNVTLAPDCVGSKVEHMVQALQPGEILLLENVRFHPGEEHPDEEPEFAEQLAKLGDVYVNDAFGTAHREHASVVNVARLFPGKAAAGFLMQKEIQFLGTALMKPQHPFVAIVGGAKISTKLGVINSLMDKADVLLIGGGMAYTFFKAQGLSIGKSIHEDDCLETARVILDKSRQSTCKLVLPVDVVVAEDVKDGASSRTIQVKEGIPENWAGVDIGPETIALFTQELDRAMTVLWNGPLGVFEIPAFAKGTNAIASALAGLKATKIVGGGDSIAALHAAGLEERIDHLSTGGGASLEYIEFGTLPGIECLSDAGVETVKE